MLRPVIALALLLTLSSTRASTAQEDAQDRIYVQCMARRNVQPGAMTKDDVAACNAEAGVIDPGEEARKVTGDAWRSCLFKQIAQFDDGVSPASDVARVIVAPCSDEWRRYAEAFYMPPRSKRSFAAGAEKFGGDDATRAVLFMRRTTASMPGASAPSKSRR